MRRRSSVRRHSRAAIESGALSRVILFKFTRESLKSETVVSNAA